MHGPTHRSGAVAGLQRVRHAARLAQLVMEQTDHSLLVGEGALRFARAHGLPEEDLLTETSRKIWLYWKQSHSDRDDWLPPPIEQLDPAVRRFFRLNESGPTATPPAGYRRSEANDRPTGTIHCACLNSAGQISCATTTSGLAFKIPGRVGDSAVVGAGLYVDQQVGSCGSTGRGEANLRICASFAAVELMRQGASPVDAGLEVLQRVVATTRESRLLGPDGRPNFGVKYYLLNARGEHAGVSLWGPSQLAVCDADGPRLESCACLFESRPADTADGR
jgi:N4-(beta-N-acetylglucosaminyl)-L-asparaginase